MSCRNGNGYTGGLSRLDVVKMGDFQVARGGGVWVVVGDERKKALARLKTPTPASFDSGHRTRSCGLCRHYNYA